MTTIRPCVLYNIQKKRDRSVTKGVLSLSEVTSSKIAGPKVRCYLGSDLTAVVDGKEKGAATNGTVAALCCLLLRSNRSWDRAALAQELFPLASISVARTALRQALLRLRRWLGPTTIEATSKKLSRKGDWEFEIEEASGESIALAYSHPVFEPFRVKKRGLPESATVRDFADFVLRIAAVDSDGARSAFLAAQSFANAMHPSDCLSILQALRPSSRQNEFALEHAELMAASYSRKGLFHEAAHHSKLAIRIAQHQGQRDRIERAKAQYLFHALESGDMTTSAELFDSLHLQIPQNKLLLRNVQVAYLWNTGRFQDALNVALESAGAHKGETRRNQLHYWSNTAVLAAEMQQWQHAQEAIRRANDLLLPHVDPEPRTNILLSTAHWEMARSPIVAIQLLDERLGFLMETGRVLHALYLREALALAHAIAGNSFVAQRTWKQVRDERRSLGGRLTPRLFSLQRRVLGSIG